MATFRTSDGRFMGTFFRHLTASQVDHCIRDEDDDVVLKVEMPIFDQNKITFNTRDFKVELKDFVLIKCD